MTNYTVKVHSMTTGRRRARKRVSSCGSPAAAGRSPSHGAKTPVQICETQSLNSKFDSRFGMAAASEVADVDDDAVGSESLTGTRFNIVSHNLWLLPIQGSWHLGRADKAVLNVADCTNALVVRHFVDLVCCT
jgi:hypothetical protein